MNVPDANVLLYAVNTDSVHHDSASEWLDEHLSGAGPVGFAWIVLVAFIRLSTSTKVFPDPLSTDEATSQVDAWLNAPTAEAIHPTAGHPETLGRLLRQAGTGGNLVNDAHLAALALEQRGRVVSFDSDFARFDVEWFNPASD